jgi:hypothetical protein
MAGRAKSRKPHRQSSWLIAHTSFRSRGNGLKHSSKNYAPAWNDKPWRSATLLTI